MFDRQYVVFTFFKICPSKCLQDTAITGYINYNALSLNGNYKL